MLESKTQTVAIFFRGYFVIIKLWLHIYFITIRLIKTNIFSNLCFFAEGHKLIKLVDKPNPNPNPNPNPEPYVIAGW